MKFLHILLIIIPIIFLAIFFFNKEEVKEEVTQGNDMIKIISPLENQIITSPLSIKGEARGGWYFEGSFPIKIYDGNGALIFQGQATATTNALTNDFVPFEAMINFNIPNTETGQIVFEKDNPSGLPENADEVRINVLFEKKERLVNLYYYNSSLDQDETGNIMCSRDGLVSVQRNIPLTITPIQNTIKLLLSGELTEEEISSGVTTEYPLTGFELKGASLKDGVLTLEFNDPNGQTVGGSCRTAILWFQISETAKQFSGVESIRFMPEELFQP